MLIVCILLALLCTGDLKLPDSVEKLLVRLPGLFLPFAHLLFQHIGFLEAKAIPLWV